MCRLGLNDDFSEGVDLFDGNGLGACGGDPNRLSVLNGLICRDGFCNGLIDFRRKVLSGFYGRPDVHFGGNFRNDCRGGSVSDNYGLSANSLCLGLAILLAREGLAEGGGSEDSPQGKEK